MPDLTVTVKKWWKQILGVVVLSLLVVGVLLFLKPAQYLSVATAIPASTVGADKAKIFNDNIESLYSTLGSPDDLDRILGTASLDTVYLAVTDEFNLFDHYKIIGKENEARTRAASRLQQNCKVMKSEYGELKVRVWDTDKDLAPQLANAILDKLQQIHQDLQSAGNEAALKGLVAGKEKIRHQIDSAAPGRKDILQSQVEQYEKLIGEYQLMVDSKPPALIVVERAKASTTPDKPKRIKIMTATAVLSLLFALFAALILDRRKTA